MRRSRSRARKRGNRIIGHIEQRRFLRRMRKRSNRIGLGRCVHIARGLMRRRFLRDGRVAYPLFGVSRVNGSGAEQRQRAE